MDEILDPESYEQLLKLRRDVYRGGAAGFVLGIVTTGLYHLGKMLVFPSFKSSNKNVMVGSLFLSAAGGSFIGANLAGRYSRHSTNFQRLKLLHPPNESEYSKLQNKVLEERNQGMNASFNRRYDAIRLSAGISTTDKKESS